jgi:hypothetical protein
MCRLLKVSPSGFYAWDERPISARERADIALTARIHEIYRRSRETYGAPMVHAELADQSDAPPPSAALNRAHHVEFRVSLGRIDQVSICLHAGNVDGNHIMSRTRTLALNCCGFVQPEAEANAKCIGISHYKLCAMRPCASANDTHELGLR